MIAFISTNLTTLFTFKAGGVESFGMELYGYISELTGWWSWHTASTARSERRTLHSRNAGYAV